MEEDGNDSDESKKHELDFPPAYMEADRKTGILTQNDRLYLLDELELSGQGERNTRYRIRQRLIQSFLDLQLLSREYSDAELEKVVDHEDIHARALSLSLVDLAYNILMAESGYTTEDFERIIEQVVRQQRVKQMPVPTSLEQLHDIGVEVDISLSEVDIQNVVDSLVESEPDIETWAAFARRADVFRHAGAFDSDDVELVPIQPPGADQSTMILEPIAEMIEKSTERHNKE